MKFFEAFIKNHVLANLTFVLVLVIGAISYLRLPREQDPTINFNWIQITTILPGASAEDVEKRVTDPLEEVLRRVKDTRFVSSTSRESASSILVRFNDIDKVTFDKRVTDLRREIQNKQSELPADIVDPDIFELTTSSGFPTATVIVTGEAADENLRQRAEHIKKDLERLKGVDRATPTGLHDPELQVLFDPIKLHNLGIRPRDLADTVVNYFKDTPAGTRKVGAEEWLIRLNGTSNDPEYLARLPITTAAGVVPLGETAQIARGREKADRLVSFNGKPAIMFGITKKENTNTLALVERINDYVQGRNRFSEQTGVRLVLADDQTEITRSAIDVMQTNALLGLFFVMLVVWLFLGLRIAFLVSIGIPFVLCGTFWILLSLGHTLNVMVLLGVVIVLGMLVDDAVVVVENIHYRINRGRNRIQAVMEALKEVVPPVTTSVLTTMAAFLPLLLMPGIMGKFMRVVPVVVTVALALSLVEAYWMLPAHILAFRQKSKEGRFDLLRKRVNHRIRIVYTKILIKSMRYAKTTLAVSVIIFSAALLGLMMGRIRVDFFASDPLRLFYVSLEMPTGAPIESSLKYAEAVEKVVRENTTSTEVRAVISYAGQLYTETEVLLGDQYGQVMVSLNPARNGMRDVDVIIENMREKVLAVPGPLNTTFLVLSGGPPTASPISVKVRGVAYPEIRAAVKALRVELAQIEGVSDISDDAARGRQEMSLRFNVTALQEMGLTAGSVARDLRLLVDGEIVAAMQDKGEELEVRVRALPTVIEDIHNLLETRIGLGGGAEVPLGELVYPDKRNGLGNIRHYGFRRAITVEAELDDKVIDTVTANKLLLEHWDKISADHPTIDLDFTGELDDIQESMDAIGVLFLFGIGLMYLIIGTQFRSYLQPLLILSTVPMAFTGVALGLWLTGNPLSLFTMYGVVALAGIAVNAAIVLISAANTRMKRGMSGGHAAIYAARRRVIPILITTLTTIAGLSSLALGLGGKSLLWGPVAIAIVFGLAFSSVLTLFIIPNLYSLFVRGNAKKEP